MNGSTMPTNKSDAERFIRVFDGLTGSQGDMTLHMTMKNDEKQLPGRIGNPRSKH
jgi:hypothetical protein